MTSKITTLSLVRDLQALFWALLTSCMDLLVDKSIEKQISSSPHNLAQ